MANFFKKLFGSSPTNEQTENQDPMVTKSIIATSENGPFGLSMGQPYDSLELAPYTPDNFFYEILAVPEPTEDFQTVIGRFYSENGLSAIQSFTIPTLDDSQGKKVMNQLNSLKKLLTKEYGKPKIIDNSFAEIRAGWMKEIFDFDRFYSVSWDSDDAGVSLPKNVSQVGLTIVAENDSSGFINLQYTFVNDKVAAEAISQNLNE